MNAPRVSGPDILTRTALRIDASISAQSILDLKRALQRVPGVLLAEINATSGLVVVAHDSAVSMASLVNAVAASGAHGSIVADPRARAVSGEGVTAPLATVRMQRLLLVATVVLLLQLIGILSPSLAKTHLLIPVALVFMWTLVAASTFRRRT